MNPALVFPWAPWLVVFSYCFVPFLYSASVLAEHPGEGFAPSFPRVPQVLPAQRSGLAVPPGSGSAFPYGQGCQRAVERTDFIQVLVSFPCSVSDLPPSGFLVSLCFLQLTPCFSKAVISQKLAWGTAPERDGVTVCVNHTSSMRDYTIPPAALGRGITGNKHACCHLEMSEL